VTRPKVKKAELEKCDSSLFAIACKPKACVPPQAGFARLGLFAVGYLMLPKTTVSFPNWIFFTSLEHGGSYHPAGSFLISTIGANSVATPVDSMKCEFISSVP